MGNGLALKELNSLNPSRKTLLPKTLSYCIFKLSNCICAEVQVRVWKSGETEKDRRTDGGEMSGLEKEREMEEVKSTVKTDKCPDTMGSLIEKELTP